MLTPWKQSYDQPREHIKKQRHYFANKGPSNQGYSFSSSHVWMWELDWKKAEHQRMMLLNCGVGEDSWESLGLQVIQLVHSKGDQSWVFIGRNDVEAEAPVLWPPDAKNWLIWKDSDAGKDWRQEKGTTEDEMSSTQWAWVWVNSSSWWWTGRPGLICFIGGVSWRSNQWSLKCFVKCSVNVEVYYYWCSDVS